MNKTRHRPFITLLKTIAVILTAIHPMFMVILSGAGIIYNRESYGSELSAVGTMLIVSGVLMCAGTVLCLPRKNAANILSVLFSCAGLAICLVMLHKLTDHADRAGWSNALTMTPISDMYTSRILPSIAPSAVSVVICVIQLFSYEASQERRRKRLRREQKENQPSEPIIED